MRNLPFSPPRLYRDPCDLKAMEQVLQAGALAQSRTHYVHTGDLRWWLFYHLPTRDLRQTTYLWDNPARPGTCLGWALIDPSWPSFEVFVQPDLLGSLLWTQIMDWAEKEAVAQALGMTHASVVTPEYNQPACALYRSAGFQAIGKLGFFARVLPPPSAAASGNAS
jgi:GNAT superfamily N-acetyltransferase